MNASYELNKVVQDIINRNKTKLIEKVSSFDLRSKRLNKRGDNVLSLPFLLPLLAVDTVELFPLKL